MNVFLIYAHGNALSPSSGSGTRVWFFVKTLVKNNINVTILHSKSSIGSEDIQLKKKCNVYYYKELSLFNASDWLISDLNPFFMLKIRKIIKRHKIDIIQIVFPWGFFITKLITKGKIYIIFDSHGVEREFMEVSLRHPSFPKVFKPFARIYAKQYEKLVCRFAQTIITCSNIDRDYYINNYNIEKKKTLVIQVASSLKMNNIKRTEDLIQKNRKKLNLPQDKTLVLFHGGIPHPPNQEAFDLIKNYIAPELKELEITFVLAGYNVPNYKKQNIISLGFVDNLLDLLYSVDFAIVPIISGSGMRVKITDYITTALPFITTKKGIEGIDFLSEGEEYLLFDTVNKDFLEGIKQMHENKKIREKFHNNLIEKPNKLSQKIIENRLKKLFIKLKSLPKE